MKIKAAFILLCLFLQSLAWNLPAAFSFTISQSSQVIYVPSNYTIIQAAINAASHGDTVFLENGTYQERVVINKSISLVGENVHSAIIDGEGDDDEVVLVTSSNVMIGNLTVQNGTYGILVENANNVIIKRNNAFNNREGIILYNSGNCTVTENNSSLNANRGIFLNSCWDSIVYRNFAMNNTAQYGINANASRNVALIQNTAINNYWDGVGLQSSTHCIVWNNNASINRIFGIWCDSSNNSLIYHNFVVNNTASNSRATDSEIWWNSDYPSGGNYWSDYNGTDSYKGQYQNETGSDGISDTPYSIQYDNQDEYPLMNPRNNGSALFFALQDRTITPIENVLIYGFLWPKLAGENVTIQYRQTGGTWQTLETVTTYADGKYSYLWTDLDEGTYELKTNWSGSPNVFPAESFTETLTVQKVISQISLSVNPQTATVGSTVTITGSISPIKPNVNVTIWHRLVGEDWTVLATVATYANSSYLFRWNTTRSGDFAVKAGWQGDEATTQANSTMVTLIVSKASSSVTINATPTTATVGSNITISGAIEPPRTGINVTIHYRPSGGTWTTLATVTTDSNSHYTYTWNATETGSYQLKTSWQGDSVTVSAESGIVTVTIEQKPSPDFTPYILLLIALIIITTSAVYLRRKLKH